MLLGGITAISLLTALWACLSSGIGLHLLWVAPLSFLGGFLSLTVLACLVLLVSGLCVDMKKPQDHDSKFYRSVMYPYIEALIAIVGIKLHTEGLEKTPKEGRFLLVCNHQNESDPGILLHVFRNSQLAFISKKEVADMFIVNKMLHRTMGQLVNRENDREALKTILKCIQLIKDDEVSVGVFPEGGIKEVGKLTHFRSGAFKIAQKANVPIVVCTLRNTADILKNAAKLKHTDVQLHLVDVIPAEDLKGRTAVDIADQVYDMMLRDLGESFRPE